MDIAESHRQYQIAMEARRRATEELGETLSMADELQDAHNDESDARREVELAWLDRLTP